MASGRSKPDCGAESTVRRSPALPAGDAQAPVPPRAAPDIVTGARVLVVEDDPEAAESLKMLLEHFGHRVRVAHDGPAALDTVRAESPMVAFVDIALPGMDGYALVRRLREEPGMKRAILVALSGYGRDEDKERTRAAGFDLHLTKPVDVDCLETLMAEVVARGVGGAERVLATGPVADEPGSAARDRAR